MKKALMILALISALLFMAGCGASDSARQPAASTETQTEAEVRQPETEADTVDVDLTRLSSTMVYSEVYAMVYEPEQYRGKTVKMHGLFATQEADGQRYYACIVQDATGCCAQGLEFELTGSHKYPEDYPEPGAEITVTGRFDTYEEVYNGDTYTYLVLRNARLL